MCVTPTLSKTTLGRDCCDPVSARRRRYWGRPSQSAVTPLGEVVFTALSMVKPREEAPRGQAELHLPLDLFTHGAKP